MRTRAKRLFIWGSVLTTITALILLDVASTVARKLKAVGLYGEEETAWVVVSREVPPAFLDPIAPPAPAQNSVVGVCQSTDAELGGLAASLSSTLTYQQVDSITRLSVQRAGGLDAIVDPGDWVVIKPNILNFPGEDAFGYQTLIIGTSTDLRVIKSLIQQLVEEGDASRVSISEGGDWWNIAYPLPPALDGIQTEDGWTAHWPHYGGLSYEDMIAEFNLWYPGITFDIVDMNYPPYTTAPVPGGGLLADTYTMPDVLDCDVLIPVATMKTHNLARITCILKHYIGVAPGEVYGMPGYQFDMNKLALPHGDNIEKVLIDLFAYHPADFALVECFWGMEGAGPNAGTPIKRNVVLASSDPVALDATDAYVMGFNPWDIDYLHWAHNRGWGTYDLDHITVNGPSLAGVRYEFAKARALGRGNRIWLVNGTYDGSTNLDAEQLGAGVEATISPVAGQMTQGNEWTVAQFTEVSDYCDLNALYEGPSNCVSYAFTQIVADQAQSAYLRVGADDGMKIWLNGSVVYNSASVGGGGWSRQEVGIPINLVSGTNRLLLKISNASSAYGFSLITTESSGDGDTPLGIEYRVTATGAPELFLDSPVNGASTPGILADLVATVIDGDGDPTTVWIYGGDTPDANELLYMEEGVPSGAQVTYTWTAPPLQVTPDTRGLWRLNENSGAAVADESGNGNTGTIAGPTWSTAGQFGPSLFFDGDPDDNLSVGNDPSLNPTTGLTHEAWVKIDDINDITDLGNKLWSRDWSLALILRPDASLCWEVMRSGGSYVWPRCNTQPGSVPIGEWVYVACTCDGDGVMKAYINGQLAATTDLRGTIATSSYPLWIGWWPGYAWHGLMDEVRVSGRSLTAAEIRANYGLGHGQTYYWKAVASDGVQSDTSETRSFSVAPASADLQAPVITLNAPDNDALVPTGPSVVDLDIRVIDSQLSPMDVWVYGGTTPTPTTLLYHQSDLTSPFTIRYPWGGEIEFETTPNTVALWHFNENAGTTVYDETGNHDGTMEGGRWNFGHFGSALIFDSGRVVVPDHPDWDTPEITVQGWVSLAGYASPSVPGTYYDIVTKGSHPSAPDYSYGLGVYNGRVVFELGNSDGSGWAVTNTDAVGATVLQTDTWYHVAATYDGSYVRIFVNGQLDANGVNNPRYYAGGMHYGDGPVTIGSRYQRSPDTYDTHIDEVRISGIALTESEVQESYVLSAGTHYWYVTARDSSGNSASSETRYINVLPAGDPDTLPPHITLHAPADGALIPEGSFADLDLTVSDPELSPVQVWIYGDTIPTPATLVHYESGLSSPADVLYTWSGGQREFAVTGNTVALWHFNENTGTTAGDETGNHDGVAMSTSWATGRFGPALRFDNADRVEIPDSPDWDTPQLTVQAWVNASSLTSGYNCILTKGSYPSPVDLGYCLALHNGRLVFLMGSADGSGWSVLLNAMGATTLATGTWYHVAVTYDGSYVRLYLDGVLDANGPANPYAYSGGVHYSAGPVDIGSSLQQATADRWYGLIDEVRVSDAALSAADIQADFTLGVGRYYWYVQAADTAGNLATSATRYFDMGTAIPPPDVPMLEAPPNAAVMSDDTPTFAWSATAGTGGTYTLQIARDAGFTLDAQSYAGIGGTTYTPGGALTSNTYYWHVQAIDAGSRPSGYQPTPYLFTVDTEAPAVPALSSPPDGAATSQTLPTFVWSATAGLSGTYTLVYALDVNFTLGVQTVTGISDTTYTAVAALADDVYYWHVEAIDQLHNASGFQTTPFSFAVDTEAPSVPSLIDPADQAVLSDNLPSFDWSATGEPGGTYTLEIASDSDFTFAMTMSGLTDTTYQVSVPFMDGEYYWHVEAIDPAGNASGFQGTTFSFTVDEGMPPVPILLEPTDSAYVCDVTPTFVWTDASALFKRVEGREGGSQSPGATAATVSYTIQYAMDPSFSSATTVTDVPATTYTVPESTPLTSGTCYWRVESVDEADHHSGYQTHVFQFGIMVAGDQNRDGVVTASDVIYLVNFTFKGGPDPQPCQAMGDANCDAAVTAGDIIYLVNHTFKGGPPPCDVGELISNGAWACP